jgi:hypothetical protein
MNLFSKNKLPLVLLFNDERVNDGFFVLISLIVVVIDVVVAVVVVVFSVLYSTICERTR